MAAAVAAMDELAPRAGWITFQPAFDDDVLPEGRAADRLLSKRPPVVPICTWVPGERSRNGIEHVALGFEHARGRGALDGVPAGWELMQDNQKRGLIVAVPPSVPHAEVLAWLLATGKALSKLPLNGEWRALVYRR